MTKEVGRPRAIESVEDFRRQSQDYIDWVLSNPVYKTVTASFQGEINYLKVPHSRPMTQYGWASHLGIGLSTLKDYGARDEFSAIFKAFSDYMTAYNIDGATSGDFNGNIIARIEGLADKVQNDLTSSDGSMTPKGLDDFDAEYGKKEA